MGSVRQKASGSWEACYRDPEGHQRGKAFPTKKAANEFLARVAVDVQRGEYVSPTTPAGRWGRSPRSGSRRCTT